MTADTRLPAQGRAAGLVAMAMRSHGWVVIGATLATVAVELGVYGAARMRGAPESSSVLAALAAAVVWVVLAAPALASGPSGHLGGYVRGLTVADASAAALLVLWLVAGSSVTFAAAAQVYCTLAAVALAGVAVVRCARSAMWRSTLAVVVSSVFMAALTTPLWIGGLMKATDGPVRRAVVAVAVYANPFYSITTALSERTGFVWHLSGVMYGLTRIGSFSPAPEPPWYAATVIYLCVAAAALGLRVLIASLTQPENS